MTTEHSHYAARLEIDHPEKLDKFSSFFRLLFGIPIAFLLGALTYSEYVIHDSSKTGFDVQSASSTAVALASATALMIIFRGRYPRWWFDFSLELARFQTRVFSYFALLSDRYPSADEEQSVHLDLDYPDVERDLHRFLPLVKWILAIPHYIVLCLLGVLALLSVILAWFAILFTGRYPKGLFDFVVGWARWSLRVQAYAFLLVTDRYPPFSMR
ncbi:MAG: DUF4389 domain-containing protein [Planctomycetota bacterium]|nr:DUF4389 domain-containing protein [Planctomycetota bacterium]